MTWLWRYSEKREAEVPEVTPVVPPGAETVLSVLSSSAVIVDADDTVMQVSAPAVAMGLVRDDRLPDELWTETFERTPGGRVIRYAAIPGMRLREVEIHHVDLRAGYGPADWDAAFVRTVLEEVPARLGPGALIRRVAEGGRPAPA